MKTLSIKASIMASLLTVAVSPLAMADHNSPFGEGWANMPNDIHNTRLDEDVSDEEFIDFVSGGDGADSVNRFLDDDDTTTVSMGTGAGSSLSGSGIGSGSMQRGR